MLYQGPAKKVTIYTSERAQYHLQPLHNAILTYLLHKGVAGATATRAFAGFGTQQQLHSSQSELRADDLPLRIEFVDSAGKVEEVLPTLYEMVQDGLIDVQDTTVIRPPRKEPEPVSRPQRHREGGPAKLLRVFLGEADKWHGEPLYDAIVKKLRMMEVAGATVYRGVLGYGAKGHEMKRSFFHPMRDLPVMITVVDSAAKIEEAVAAVETMLEDGLIVISDVEMVRVLRGADALPISPAKEAIEEATDGPASSR